MIRLTVLELQRLLGVKTDDDFGDISKGALRVKLTNRNAPAITHNDFVSFASLLRCDLAIIKAVRKVEAPRGAFDPYGLLTSLYERHKFRNNTVPVGRFNGSHPALSGPPYGKGGYGTFAGQFDKFASACALDPQAAFEACSWGAFQVLGENWSDLRYPSVWDMVTGLAVSEVAHLDSFVRYVQVNGLEDELRACKPGDAASCVPFVSRYNGPDHAVYGYAPKLASEALKIRG